MKATLPVLLTLFVIGALALSPLTISGQTVNRTPKLAQSDVYAPTSEDESDEDDEPVQRVARITFVQGDVSFLRAGVQEWSDAAENLPLLTGDQLYVGNRGRVEIQFGRGNYVRLSEKTALTITELSQTAALLEITEGIATVRLERFGSAWERFEVDTPNSALVLQKDGLYRVNVRGENESEVIIRRGLAEVFSDDGNFKVREGQRLTVDTTPNGRLQIAADNSNDDWDRWSYDRDRQADYVSVSSAPDYVQQYETDYNDFYGASDLTNYGYWTSYSSYGNCWVPRVSSNWAPYRAGQWLWIPRAGWTWLSSEPWGWAPYHYGRWVFLNNIGWAWSPGFRSNHYNYGRSYYQWRPALVSFFNCPTPRGSYVGWYPLAPGERWRRSGNFGGDGFRGNNRNGHLQYPVARGGNRRPDGRNDEGGGFRPRLGSGVTVLPVEGFSGNGRTKFKPGAPDTDVNTYIGKRARAGLPDLGDNANAYVNTKVAKQGDAANSFRNAARPPQEVLGRSIVTRQRTTETQAENAVPRERRFIGTPSLKQFDGEIPNTKRGRRGDANNGDSSQASQGSSDATQFGRKNRTTNPEGDSSRGNVGNGTSGSANGVITDETIRKRNRSGEETPETRKGENSSNDSSAGSWKARNRTTPVGNPEGDADAGTKRRERANQNNNGSATEGEKNDSSKRVYIPREQPQGDSQDEENRKARRAARQEQERQQQQQQEQEQQRQEQQRRAEKEQRRAERQQQEQEQQRRAEKQQQEQQRQEQQRQEQRRAEKQQQQQQEQQRNERRAEKQQRKNGGN
jgi:hypothetical protein